MTRAAAATLECTVSQAANRHRAGRSRSDAAACRAVTSAERFPAEPPLTNTPPASGGSPAAPASHASAWFSAQIAPAPSIQPAAIVEDAPTIRSNSTLALVGAPGTNASDAGWSVEIVAGREHLAPQSQGLLPADPRGGDRRAGPAVELGGRHDGVERLRAAIRFRA